MGRRKIEIKPIKSKSARQVAFSKRRTGVFKKANELAILCGVKIAIIIFSPGGKAFSFGYPTVDSIIQRFLNDDEDEDDDDDLKDGSRLCSSLKQRREKARVAKLKKRHDDLMKQLDAEKKKGDAITRTLNSNHPNKFIKLVNQLSLEEVKELKSSLEEAYKKLQVRVGEMDAMASLLLLSKGEMSEREMDE